MIPIDGSQTENIDLLHKACLSLVMGTLIFYVSYDNWAFGIAIIEIFLCMVGLVISRMGWNSVFGNHYVQIQDIAFLSELLIIFGASMSDQLPNRVLHRIANLRNRTRI